jgi:biotin synthase
VSRIVDRARSLVFEGGTGLDEDGILAVLTSPDEELPDLLAVAHDVRMRWCGLRLRSRASSR